MSPVAVSGRVVITHARPGPLRRGQGDDTRAFVGATVVAKDVRGKAVATADAGQDGRFRLSLPPARYVLQIAVGEGAVEPRCDPVDIDVNAQQPPASVELSCDSGMR